MQPKTKPRTLNVGRQRRTLQACDACHKRKIHCDAVRPNCNWCSHQQLPCTYDRIPYASLRRKRPVDTAQVSRPESGSGSSRQITKRGGGQRPKLPSGNGDSGELLSPDTELWIAPTPRSWHFASHSLRSISSYSGILLFSPAGQQWMQSRIGEKVSLEKLSALGLPWEFQQNPSTISWTSDHQRPIELPDRSLVEKCAALYHSSDTSLVFPLVDKALLGETIERAYCASGHFRELASSKACIFAFLAFSSLVRVYGTTAADIDGEPYALAARSYLPSIIEEIGTVDGLQACLMLAVYHGLSGNLVTTDVMIHSAARIIFRLGANFCTSKASHLRNLFWICYMIDKEFSLRTGQPPSLSDDDCDLTPPEKYFENRVPARSFPNELPLTIMKSKIYTSLYSVRARQKTDAELLQTIRELDCALERWRTLLPADVRPNLGSSQEAMRSCIVDMRGLMLHLEYYYCMAIIHQASSRCTAGAENGSGQMDVVSSCQELSVQASRCSLLCLAALSYVVEEEFCWYFCFYPTTAFLTLFCNLLQYPEGPTSVKDVELLKEATASLIKILTSQHLSTARYPAILVESFTSELSRLADIAVVKLAERWRSIDDPAGEISPPFNSSIPL